jgi:hypothetical protein
MRRRDIRIATLPPEVPDRVLKEALNKYGEVLDIKEESWTTSYRYKVSNGVRLAKTKLKHLQLRILIAGHTCDINYPGQPQTCFACNKIGHTFQLCPHRRRGSPNEGAETNATWAQLAAPEMRQKVAVPLESIADDNPQLDLGNIIVTTMVSSPH